MILVSFMSMLQQAPSRQPGGGSFITALFPFILVFVIFYLLIIMPSRRKQKRHQEMVGQLKSGDKVITTGGIHGTVMGVQADKIEIKISANVKVDITKNAVAVIVGKKTESK